MRQKKLGEEITKITRTVCESISVRVFSYTLNVEVRQEKIATIDHTPTLAPRNKCVVVKGASAGVSEVKTTVSRPAIDGARHPG